MRDINKMICVVTSIKEIKTIIDYNIGGVERQEVVTKCSRGTLRSRMESILHDR